MKKKIFTVVLCLMLIVSSIGVSAASTSTDFGNAGRYASAFLRTYYGFGTAETEPISTSYVTIGAWIRFYGSVETWNWATGEWDSAAGRWVAHQATADLDGVYMAESYHFIDTANTYLTAKYY